jgi:small conductance mechanosensitive channel
MQFDPDIALKVAGIVVAALVGIWALRYAMRAAIRHLLERRQPEAEPASMSAVELERRLKTLQNLGTRVGAALIGLVALLTILSLLDIEIGPAIAGLGVAGIAVGFGAQTLVRDWLAGIFIVLENQYSTGDVVSIAGVEGVVEDFSLRRTVLRDLDGTVHNVPNGQIVVASNMTRGWARVNLDISVAHDTDIDRASATIDGVGEALLRDPAWSERLIEAPSVQRVSAIGDAAITLKILGQVRPAEQWAVAGELRKRILAAFAAEGIEIPHPRQVMLTREGSAALATAALATATRPPEEITEPPDPDAGEG